MALNTLKISTDGYLKRTTKAVLIIAVAGYLNFGGTPPVPPSPPSGGGGGGGSYQSQYDDTEKKQREEREKIQIENSEIIAIVELTLREFTI